MTSKWVAIGYATLSGIGASLAFLPYPWAHTASGALEAGMAVALAQIGYLLHKESKP